MINYEQVMEEIIKFRDDREWKKFHTPENLSKSISIEAAELLELFQWGDDYDKNKIKEELSDILIYCFLLANEMQINPFEAINDKIKLNERRFPIELVKGNSGKSTKIKL